MVQRKTLEEFSKIFSAEFLEAVEKEYDAISKELEDRKSVEKSCVNCAYSVGHVDTPCNDCVRRMHDYWKENKEVSDGSKKDT
jgi:cytidine deaminase